MKRVLVISYYWPPTGGSGVQRWVKFVKYLPSQGWQPVIYTPENPEQLAVDESLLAEIPPETEVIRTHITEPYGIYRRLFGKKKGSGEVNPINAGRKTFKQKAALWVRGNLFIPDPRVWWVRPSVRYLGKYLEEHPVDVIVTTGPPHSMHLIGRALHGSTGIPWVADFRDPWTRMFYFKHLGLGKCAEKKHHRLEKQVLDDASAVVAVTPYVQKDFAGMTRTPVVLITNGYDEDDFNTPPRVKEEGPCGDADGVSRRFTLVHTGLFAADGNPTVLWDALADKCAADASFASAMQIRLAGKVDAPVLDSIRERGLALEYLGYLPHERTVEEQMAASVLLLPLRRDPEYAKVYPGKIFEYLAARRPVLGTGQSDGASALLLRETRAGDMFGWEDKAGARAYIDRCWESYLSGDSFGADAGIGQYSRRSLTARMAALFEAVSVASARRSGPDPAPAGEVLSSLQTGNK